MKNRKNLRILTALLLMLMTGFLLQAQAQTSQEAQKQAQQKEMQVKEMEMQLKKQQLEQEQKMMELEKVYEEQARRSSRSSGIARENAAIYVRPGDSDEGTYFIQSYGQGSQSQLTLRNSFSGETLSSTGEFEVDESARHLRFTLNGKVRHGEITIRVLYPGGKVFKDLTINSSAEITFSQSVTIKEEEKNKYIGTWKYEVKTKTAEGNYMLSIITQ